VAIEEAVVFGVDVHLKKKSNDEERRLKNGVRRLASA
jgi:hypothetical protein